MQTYRFASLMLAGVASITLGGSAARAQSLSVLHTFTGTPDGLSPYAAMINVDGTLYGTTSEGGAANMGTVFTITPAGVESVIYSFQGGADGEAPMASLIKVGGMLYGTTSAGGAGDCGTVFNVTPAGAEAVLYAFKCSAQNDGAYPRAGLLNVGGKLYGTTEYGGSGNVGTVFKVTQTGKETVVHSFSDEAFNPLAALINVGGTLYGTTPGGGTNGLGTVFTISPGGQESVLYSFQYNGDAINPEGALLNVGGTLYGTSIDGGANTCGSAPVGCGAVFKITLKGKETVLYSFGGKPDGEWPEAGLINVNGTLYGTTFSGGYGKKCRGEGYGNGCGTIFKMTPAGAVTIVQSLSLDDGTGPTASLLKLGHLLYGTTSGDIDRVYGTVFAVSPH
jgi:uncharacterized repeat protein (TIGR03803 family)